MKTDPAFSEASISAHLDWLYHQIGTPIKNDLAPVLRWVNDSAGDHAAFLRLPFLTCQAAGGDTVHALPVAAAWHLLYCAAHLLDDVADGAPVPCEPAHAVNVAVTLIFVAQTSLTTLAQSGVAPERALALVETFNAAATRIALGQAADLAWDEQAATLDDYWRVAGAKSGECFALACRAGAMLGAREPGTVDNLAAFGYHLGVLVQLGDDLRALWQPRHQGDLHTAGRALPMVYAHSVASTEMGLRLRALARRACDEPTALTELQAALTDLGALQYLALQAGRHRQLARDALLASTQSGAVRDQLLKLLDGLSVAGAVGRWTSFSTGSSNHPDAGRATGESAQPGTICPTSGSHS